MLTSEEVYAAARALPLSERLRLAARIIEDLPALPNPQNMPGYSGAWSDEDIRDFAAHSARYAASLSSDDEALLPPQEELDKLQAERVSV